VDENPMEYKSLLDEKHFKIQFDKPIYLKTGAKLNIKITQ
jgi:hypothetical protein